VSRHTEFLTQVSTLKVNLTNHSTIGRNLKLSSKDQIGTKSYQRRYIYGHEAFWTDAEKEKISEVKQLMKKSYNVDFDKIKEFGPRYAKSIWNEAENKLNPELGVDKWVDDSLVLTYLVGNGYDIKKVSKQLLRHFHWRQTFVPRVKLTNNFHKLIHKGVMYIHGRTKSQNPILILRFGTLGELLGKKEMGISEF
jgi:hypothetical protein